MSTNIILRKTRIHRIQYLSDIHAEFVGSRGIEAAVMRIVPKAPVLVLAGDIGVCGTPEYSQFLKSVSKKFEHTFFIHGNHEYYSIGKTDAKYEDAVLCSKMLELESDGRLHFLHNSTYDLDDRLRFIGTTLWSKVDSKLDSKAEDLINDFSAIPWMFPTYYNYLHHKARAFLKKEIKRAELENKIPIVITHHLPSFGLIDPKYRHYSKMNKCFASHSDDIIGDSVAAWIYGHTHSPTAKVWTNGKTRMVCNPVGYPGERKKIDYGTVVEVEDVVTNTQT